MTNSDFDIAIHDWQLTGFDAAGRDVWLAPIVDERRRCACTYAAGLNRCQREATQEDGLCTDCRTHHAVRVSAGTSAELEGGQQ